METDHCEKVYELGVKSLTKCQKEPCKQERASQERESMKISQTVMEQVVLFLMKAVQNINSPCILFSMIHLEFFFSLQKKKKLFPVQR